MDSGRLNEIRASITAFQCQDIAYAGRENRFQLHLVHFVARKVQHGGARLLDKRGQLNGGRIFHILCAQVHIVQPCDRSEGGRMLESGVIQRLDAFNWRHFDSVKAFLLRYFLSNRRGQAHVRVRVRWALRIDHHDFTGAAAGLDTQLVHPRDGRSQHYFTSTFHTADRAISEWNAVARKTVSNVLKLFEQSERTERCAKFGRFSHSVEQSYQTSGDAKYLFCSVK